MMRKPPRSVVAAASHRMIIGLRGLPRVGVLKRGSSESCDSSRRAGWKSTPPRHGGALQTRATNLTAVQEKGNRVLALAAPTLRRPPSDGAFSTAGPE